MKRCLEIACVLVVLRSFGGTPLHAQTLRWPELQVNAPTPFEVEAIQLDDQRRAEAGELELYARTLDLRLTTWQDGAWSTEGADRVCRIAFTSNGAQAMELLFEEMDVPPGARVRMWTLDGIALSEEMPLDLPDGVMECSSPMVYADAAVLEYREPLDAAFQGRFAINGLAHAYRYVKDVMREGPCHVSVTCQPESNGWEDVIRATVRISVVTPEGNGWCSGTLVNNVRQDCAPYILSAFHCGRTSTSSQFNQYKFYFNFQYANCSGGAYSTAQFVTGAQQVAFSNDYAPQFQGLGGSDFTLLRTNTDIPDVFDPYWAGWDATNIASVTADGVCVHHPSGAPKRISTYTQTLTTGHPMTSSGLMSHYRAKWAATQNGHGVTEYGSSGAGLFKPGTNSGPVLIGTLTGSSSGMTCDNNAGTSYFGKMSYHWTNNPNTAPLKLKPWLDPDDTGTLVLGGSAHPCGNVAGLLGSVEVVPLRVWPNPANGTVEVAVPDQLQLPVQASLVDGTGRTLERWSLRSRTNALSVRDIPAGVHILTLAPGSEHMLRSKLVVTH